VRTLQTPDGREWEVSVAKGILPPWRATDAPTRSEDEREGSSVQRSLIGLLFGVLVVPLVIFLIELPIRLVLSPFFHQRRVTAISRQPTKARVTWKTRASDDVALAAELVHRAPSSLGP
jgi:hypothetical protein